MPKITSDSELEIIEKVVSKYPAGVRLDELLKTNEITIPRRTLQRRLSSLIKKGRLTVSGKGAGSRYQLVPISSYTELQLILTPESELIQKQVNQPLKNRTSVNYNRRFLDAYRPNETFYLPYLIREHLKKIGSHPGLEEQVAGTYTRKILNHLFVDLSWNSSRLEGNTYSLLETEKLLDLGEKPENKSAKDTQMILNHKAAIEFLVDSAEDITFNRFTILNLHALLSDNLLSNSAACGKVRSITVDIAKTAYTPLNIPQLIEECFQQILDVACKIQDPFEQAFFIMVHLPYLQPFEDVNKRVSRLAANIPLIRKNLSPLAFIDVSEKVYIDGMLGIYELNRVELLRDVFVWAYKKSCDRYTTLRQVLGEPDPFRLKYRQQLIELIREVIRRCLNASESINYIQFWIENQIQNADRARFRELVETELLKLHSGNIARFRIKGLEFEKWREVFMSTDNVRWKMGENEEIYCWNPVADLNEASFESTIITMAKERDKGGLYVTSGKKPQALVVSSANAWIAKKLCENSIYKSTLPEGYKVDSSLHPGQWYIKYVKIY